MIILRMQKIFKIYEDLSNTRDAVYIGSACDTKSSKVSLHKYT